MNYTIYQSQDDFAAPTDSRDFLVERFLRVSA